MTVTRRIRSPGRARNNPLKPLRAGMPGESGATCGDYARVLVSHFAREAMGALGTRHSPRPLFSWAHNSCTTRARIAPRIADPHLNQSGAALNSIGAYLKALPGRAFRYAAGRRLQGSAALPIGILTDDSLFCDNSGGYGRATAHPADRPGDKT